jgi:hypothetical protein
MSTKIYELIDPRTGEVKYIGQTKDPVARLNSHIAAGHLSDYDRWIIDLIESGHKPEMRIIKTVSERMADEVESDEISRRLDAGHNLVNCPNAPVSTGKLYKLDDLEPGIYTARDIASITGVSMNTAHKYADTLDGTDEWRKVDREAPKHSILIHNSIPDERLPPSNVNANKWLTLTEVLSESDAPMTTKAVMEQCGLGWLTATKYMKLLVESGEWREYDEEIDGDIAALKTRGRRPRILVRVDR